MKRIFVIIFILLFVVFLCMCEIFVINKFTFSIEENISKAVEYAYNNDMDKAKESAQESLNQWEKYKRSVAMFIVHNNIEEIGQSLAYMNSKMNKENTEDFFAEAEKILLQLDYIRMSEIPYWENIL